MMLLHTSVIGKPGFRVESCCPASRQYRGRTIARGSAGASQASAAAAPFTGNAASQQQASSNSSRRQMLLASCACCSALMPGLQPAQASEGYTFTYGEEAGPLTWGGTCSTGTQQSPIDLPRHAPASCSSQAAPVFQYQRTNTVRVKNTGTTIQVNFDPGNCVTWGDTQLELLQYHFHTPSEHAFDGQRAAMEAHLVHRNKNTGGFAVVAVLMEPPQHSTARPNPCLAAALANVPAAPQTEASCPTNVDPQQLLPTGPAAKQFVHYSGSLTTPPCSEQVDWLVWQQPLAVPEKQVLGFMLFTGSGKTYGHNSRPLQPLNSRALDYNCLSPA